MLMTCEMRISLASWVVRNWILFLLDSFFCLATFVCLTASKSVRVCVCCLPLSLCGTSS